MALCEPRSPRHDRHVDARHDSRLVVLDRDECLTLLQLEAVGRIATASGDDAPVVLPVNYVLDGESPVFRTDEHSVIHALGEVAISLEIDRFDWFRHIGWSVLVTGVAEDATGQVDESWIDTWAPGERHSVVRIRVDEIAGRRIELAPSPHDDRGYL